MADTVENAGQPLGGISLVARTLWGSIREAAKNIREACPFRVHTALEDPE